MEGVLEGIRVFDFSRYAAGPYCSELLAQMGAEVIRVERPGGEEDRTVGPPLDSSVFAFLFLSNSPNKKCITLNLQTEKGKEIVKDLVRNADVILHNFAPEVAKTLGMEYEALKKVDPAIIVAAITGFGQYGPHSQRLAFDVTAQAMSGAMALTGHPGDPPTRSIVSFIDYGSGILTAFGIMLALYHRQRTGRGQLIDTALMDVAISFTSGLGIFTEYTLYQAHRLRIGNNSFWTVADCFKTKDGWVFLYAAGNYIWRRFLRAIGKEELADDPRFRFDYLRFSHRHILRPIIEEWTSSKPTAEVVDLLTKARVPCSPVNTIPTILEDPQVKAREMLVDFEYPGVGKIKTWGVPIKFSETPGKTQKRPPLLGEHNEEIYCGLLSFSPEELSQLEAGGVI